MKEEALISRAKVTVAQSAIVTAQADTPFGSVLLVEFVLAGVLF